MCRNARFCLICNYVNKIIPALQSRCTRFRFPPLPQPFVQARLSEICETENVTVRGRRLFLHLSVHTPACVVLRYRRLVQHMWMHTPATHLAWGASCCGALSLQPWQEHASPLLTRSGQAVGGSAL